MIKKIIKFCILFFLLEIILQISNITFIPTPSTIFLSFIKDFKTISYNLLITLVISISSLIISILLSLLIATIFDLYPKIKKIFLPYIYVIQLIPTIILAPIFIIWFGFGYINNILLLIIMCLFPLIINLTHGFNNIDKNYYLLANTYNLNKVDLYTKIKLKFILKDLFKGLEITITYLLSTAVIIEFIGAQNGLGVYLSNALTSFNISGVYTTVLIVIIITLLLLKILKLFKNKISIGEL